MTSTADQSTAGVNLTNLTGETHTRFVIVTTLLSLIDPVRGEPTTHSLDRHPHDDSWKHEQLQKKFLDSFALIASTSRIGGETASAVCLEQGHPGGTVLRLASNRGVRKSTVGMLQEVLADLSSIASREKTAESGQHELMNKITVLTKDKILSILDRLDHPHIHAEIQDAMIRMTHPDSVSQYPEQFCTWVRNLPSVVALQPDAGSDVLIRNIEWASQARWIYPDQLEALLGSNEGRLPPWLKHIYKLGRYHSAAKAMLKVAIKQPGIFDNIHVEAIQNPPQEDFSLGNESRPLLAVLSRLTKDPIDLQAKLGQIWLTHDPEAKLRRACRTTLTVHAEMQLLSFYDHNPDRTPRLLFMGTSKKACYLCYEFMSRHPLAIGVSASHQKLYNGWNPAPCSSSVRKTHKVLLWEFIRFLEQTTARDLETRLGSKRPNNSDSTAGPSLTTTGTASTEPLSSRPPGPASPSSSHGE